MTQLIQTYIIAGPISAKNKIRLSEGRVQRDDFLSVCIRNMNGSGIAGNGDDGADTVQIPEGNACGIGNKGLVTFIELPFAAERKVILNPFAVSGRSDGSAGVLCQPVGCLRQLALAEKSIKSVGCFRRLRGRSDGRGRRGGGPRMRERGMLWRSGPAEKLWVKPKEECCPSANHCRAENRRLP